MSCLCSAEVSARFQRQVGHALLFGCVTKETLALAADGLGGQEATLVFVMFEVKTSVVPIALPIVVVIFVVIVPVVFVDVVVMTVIDVIVTVVAIRSLFKKSTAVASQCSKQCSVCLKEIDKT